MLMTPFHHDLWQSLAENRKTTVLYGMGDGADKIIRVLEEKGIPFDDIFASDEFVRGQIFHDKKVLRYEEIEQKYSDFRILVCFASSRGEVLDRIRSLNAQRELYIPDVPVCGGTLFTRDFAEEHRRELEQARALLADEESVRIFDNVLLYKLSGRFSYLEKAVSRDDPYLSLFHSERYRIAVDAGAYTGDTAASMLRLCPAIRRIYAIEPDPKSYKKLRQFAEQNPAVFPLWAAASDHVGEISFCAAGGRGAHTGQGRKEVFVPSVSIDALEISGCDHIKYDVEGAEAEALTGSLQTILRDMPELLVSLYHRSEDLFHLPLLIHEMAPEYRMFLRRKEGFPAWDLDLICIRCR